MMGSSGSKEQSQRPGKGAPNQQTTPTHSFTALPGLAAALPSVIKGKKGFPLIDRTTASDFNLIDVASNFTQRFSVLSSLSFISFVSVPQNEPSRRMWSRVSRKRWHASTLQNEYAQCKTVWPVAQTEALFLPEFPVGLEEKIKLIFLGEISRGAFGQVFHVRCVSSGKEFAMKVLSKSQVCSLDAVRQVKQEVMIQNACSHHPFITPLTHFWQTRKLLIVMTEYIGYGELQQLWRSLGRLPECLLVIYITEIAIALDFLHNAGIIYRDLKMENILLDVDGHIKLIDFGLSKWLPYGARTRTICGTLQFMAPEILKGEDYGHAADWWSLGVIGYSLLAGHYPVSGYGDHVSMSNAVDSFGYSPPPHCSPAMQSLLSGLLHRNPAARIHSLHGLEKEELLRNTDVDDVRDKKISPRRTLEDYIEGKSRHNFEEFAGLTSTPKKSVLPSVAQSSISSCAEENVGSVVSSTSRAPSLDMECQSASIRNVSWKDLREERLRNAQKDDKSATSTETKSTGSGILTITTSRRSSNISPSRSTGILSSQAKSRLNERIEDSEPGPSKKETSNFGSRDFSRMHRDTGQTFSMFNARSPMRHYTTRSTSSPLLASPLKHPGRLGHHDALVKSVSVCGYNGAAVPLLQSPLLRLARGQKAPVSRGQKSINAGALPKAVSPLLVNVRGKSRGSSGWRRGDRWDQDYDVDDMVGGMNGVYQKSLSDECVSQKALLRKGSKGNVLQRSKTGINTRHLIKGYVHPEVAKLKPLEGLKKDRTNRQLLESKEKSLEDEDTLPPISDSFFEVPNTKEEFFGNLITSTPKKTVNKSGENAPSASGSVATVKNDPSASEAGNVPTAGTASSSCAGGGVACCGQSAPTSTAACVSVGKPVDVAEDVPTSSATVKYNLINGTMVGIKSTNNPLNENDFDEPFHNFPWISESLDNT